MGARSKLLAVIAAILAIGLSACGGNEDSGSTATETETETETSPQGSSASQHEDSGGGSEQFRAKGGDNSIQDFGEEADADEFEAAAAVLHDFLDTRAAEDWDSTCAAVTEEVRQSLEKLAAQAKRLDDTSCAGVLGALTNPAAKQVLQEEATQADAASLRIEDDRGYIIYRGPKGVVLALPMAREDGEWKVSGLGGTPIA